MKKKYIIFMIMAILISFTLTGCIPGDGTYTSERPAGFLWGVWHGWIAPISLIVGLFKDNISIYETVNTGWWYDLGFYIAVISGFGGVSLSRKKKKEKKE
ncbi:MULTISPECIES: hypothetical protein [unclassified Dehalobacter]|uniref:hypothetical protein n=1 Tax=unclassified Dehalobacter TaxID=2635733 RepID=UPI000E6CCA60|nr:MULTISPECIES: hypothetical protein [unclassified Dehalobacter]RJE47231.1 hypothetical protein A7K50_04480 [Dehalobacter sp. MCB1]TCX53523.1 hypothetical protein C1I36_01905 [Dehalobacter sp. 14DCB1]TCX54908.1 hypothetical protein C1I38_04305 [Dehalobacter sp. 12DCB1]